MNCLVSMQEFNRVYDAQQKPRGAWRSTAWHGKAKAKRFSTVPGRGIFAGNLPEVCSPTRPLFLIKDNPGHKKIPAQQRRCRSIAAAGQCVASPSTAKQRRRMAERCVAWRSKAKAKLLLHSLVVPGVFSFSIQTIGNAQEIPGREDVDVNFFRCPGIGMSENDTDHMKGHAFDIQFRGEIMPEGMRPEPWYPGMPGKFFTQTV